LLGTSVESVRRRIKAGKIDAFYDARGRVRIHASLPSSAAEEGLSSNLAGLWDELKATRSNLIAATAEARELRRELDLAHFHRREAQHELQSQHNEALELRDELETARQALEHTQNEMASMWRVMSSRRQAATQDLTDMTDGNEAFDLPPSHNGLTSERARIQSQISRIRDLSKRRRWPWPQAS
jgi:chromosome segregation ATPase